MKIFAQILPHTIWFLLLIPKIIYGNETSSSSETSFPKPTPFSLQSTDLSISTNLQTQHIWRGNLTCATWNAQPTLSISKGNFLLGTWGAFTIDNSYTEIDLYASYTIGSFSFSLLNYFCPGETLSFKQIIDFNQNTTHHTLDFSISFVKSDEFPLRISSSTFIWGDDLHFETGRNLFSTYIETGYTWERTEQQEFDFSLGLTPFEGYYAHKFSLISCGFSIIQTIVISEIFHLPVFGKLVVNPYSENIFFLFGLTLGV